jgi:hypothetical protein
VKLDALDEISVTTLERSLTRARNEACLPPSLNSGARAQGSVAFSCSGSSRWYAHGAYHLCRSCLLQLSFPTPTRLQNPLLYPLSYGGPGRRVASDHSDFASRMNE